MILKALALAACVIGFVFLGPKALAEFRRAHPRTRPRLTDTTESARTGDKPQSDVAA